MGRNLSPDELNVLRQPDYKIYGRLKIQNFELADFTGGVNPLLSATVIADLDQVVQQATFVCRLGEGATSLSPYLSTGASLGGVPILTAGFYIDFEVQCTLAGQAPTFLGWRRVFHGLVDTVDVSPGDSTVTIHCRDAMVRLLRTEIENMVETDQGWQLGFPVEAGLVTAQIQAILDTAWNYSFGVPYPEPFAVVGTDPGTTATEYWQQPVPTLDAARAIGVGKNGWDLRGKWDLPAYGPDTFILAYYLPDRASVNPPVVILGPTRTSTTFPATIRRLSWSVVGVKNIARIIPADAARVPVITVNQPSIDRYNRAFLGVSEDKASHIDTAGEAGDLGGIIVSDLGTPKAAIEIEAPFLWQCEVNDVFLVDNYPRFYDQLTVRGLFFSITRVELSYKDGAGSTVLTGREDTGASQASAWRSASAQLHPKKEYIRLTDPIGPATEGATWYKVDDLTLPTPL